MLSWNKSAKFNLRMYRRCTHSNGFFQIKKSIEHTQHAYLCYNADDEIPATSLLNAKINLP
jgi:hypothetical protein